MWTSRLDRTGFRCENILGMRQVRFRMLQGLAGAWRAPQTHPGWQRSACLSAPQSTASIMLCSCSPGRSSLRHIAVSRKTHSFALDLAHSLAKAKGCASLDTLTYSIELCPALHVSLQLMATASPADVESMSCVPLSTSARVRSIVVSQAFGQYPSDRQSKRR